MSVHLWSHRIKKEILYFNSLFAVFFWLIYEGR